MSDGASRTATTPSDAPNVVRVRSADVDQTRFLLSRLYYPIAVGVPDGADAFTLDVQAIQLGPLTAGHLVFSQRTGLIASHLDGYHVTLPTAGRVRARQADREVLATEHTAAVFRPGDPVHTLHDSRTTQFDVKIERSALETELSALLGREVSGPIDLAPEMSTVDGPGRSLRRLVSLLCAELPHRDSMIHHPLIAGRVRESLLTGLLYSAPHRYHDELIAPAPAGAPRAIRRVMNAISDEPDKPFTVTDLAALAGMSVRSLQEGFRRHVGTAPMNYLQQVRLTRVHDALRRADPGRVTVAAVAHRWGFAHLGRFASTYRARYGESPSETLRRAV